MYKEASKQKLRIPTDKGQLSIEQMWDLSIEDLDKTAVKLEEAYNSSGKKSFLVKKSQKDKTAKLMLDITLDILTTKVEEKEALAEAREIKEYNAKIFDLIAKKQDSALEGKSIKELEKLLK